MSACPPELTLLCSLCFSHQIIFYCLLLGFAFNQSATKKQRRFALHDCLYLTDTRAQLNPSTQSQSSPPVQPSVIIITINTQSKETSSFQVHAELYYKEDQSCPVLLCYVPPLSVSAHSSKASSSHHPVNNNIEADDKRRLKWKS